MNDLRQVMKRGPFDIIVADPPWPESSRTGRSFGTEFGKRGFKNHCPRFETMLIQEICHFPGENKRKFLFADNALLFMWCTWRFLPLGLRVLEAWGFEYGSGMPWVKRHKSGKLKTNLGRWVLGCSEMVLFARNGRFEQPTKMRPGLLESMPDKLVHARKPEELQDWIEEAFTGQNRLELFARRNRPGWTCYGNEV